jgi:hypothetical protein
MSSESGELCVQSRDSSSTDFLNEFLRDNWLRVLGTTKPPQIDQQALEFVFPRKCPFHPVPQCMDRFIEQSLASSLGTLAVSTVLVDVRSAPH